MFKYHKPSDSLTLKVIFMVRWNFVPNLASNMPCLHAAIANTCIATYPSDAIAPASPLGVFMYPYFFY